MSSGATFRFCSKEDNLCFVFTEFQLIPVYYPWIDTVQYTVQIPEAQHERENPDVSAPNNTCIHNIIYVYCAFVKWKLESGQDHGSKKDRQNIA